MRRFLIAIFILSIITTGFFFWNRKLDFSSSYSNLVIKIKDIPKIIVSRVQLGAYEISDALDISKVNNEVLTMEATKPAQISIERLLYILDPQTNEFNLFVGIIGSVNFEQSTVRIEKPKIIKTAQNSQFMPQSEHDYVELNVHEMGSSAILAKGRGRPIVFSCLKNDLREFSIFKQSLSENEYLDLSDAPLVGLGLLKNEQLSIKYWMKGNSEIKHTHFLSETDVHPTVGFFFFSPDQENQGLKLVHPRAYTTQLLERLSNGVSKR